MISNIENKLKFIELLDEMKNIEREKLAFIQIEEVVWSECFFDIKQIISEYELQESQESRFVYQLDKLHPMIQNVIKWEGNSWQEYKMEKNKILEKKYSTIDNEFWLRKILDIYIQKAEKKNMFYEGE